MFLVDSATHALPKAMTLLATVCQYGPAIYEGLLKPMPRNEALYLGISAEIQRTKLLTITERDQMHQYASRLLQGDTDLPPGMSQSLACQLRGIMAGEASHFRRAHPLQARMARVAV